MPLSRPRLISSWVAQLVAAAILGVAGFAKLSGAEDSVTLFSFLGVEPWGRYLVGGLEAIATVLLLMPRTALAGAGLGALLMLGALATHLLKIGVMYGGNPDLFLMAWTVLAACLTTAWCRRSAAE